MEQKELFNEQVNKNDEENFDAIQFLSNLQKTLTDSAYKIEESINRDNASRTKMIADFQSSQKSAINELRTTLKSMQQEIKFFNQRADSMGLKAQSIEKQIQAFSSTIETTLSQSITKGTTNLKIKVDSENLRCYLDQALVLLNASVSKIQSATENVNSNIDNTLKNAQDGVNEAIRSYRDNTTPIRAVARLKKFIYSVAVIILILFLIQFGFTWHSTADIIGSKNKALVDSSDVFESQALHEYIVNSGEKGQEIKEYIVKKMQERNDRYGTILPH